MFTIILILAGGLLLGRIFLLITRRHAALAERLLGFVVWAMLAAFGLRIGTDAAIMDSLHILGLQALVLGLGATLLSGVAVALAFRRYVNAIPELTDTRRTSFSGSSLKGSAITLFFFAAGLAAGRLNLLPVSSATAGAWAQWLLMTLIALVGISTGSNPRLITILRGIRPVIIAIPVIAVVTSLVAGGIIGVFCPVGSADGALAVSGMGYYSLSSMIISEMKVDALGEAGAMSLAAIALIANIVREISALVLIPVVGPRLGVYGSAAMCGVTSIDVTLPTLASTFGAEAIPVGLVNGIILEVTTPFTVTLAATIL